MLGDTLKVFLGKIAKPLFFVLGMFAFIVGLIGIVVPGLPTTPLMIVAAACFVRSSDKWYNRVVNNRLFGKAGQDFQEGNGMPRRAKLLAWSMMWAFGAYAIVWGIPDRLLYVRILVFVLLLIGTVYIFRLPTKSRSG